MFFEELKKPLASPYLSISWGLQRSDNRPKERQITWSETDRRSDKLLWSDELKGATKVKGATIYSIQERSDELLKERRITKGATNY